ncbi:MAG: hypothetical protein IKR48_09815 [Kiritimatiellae bacterium]|nr:hypothetical protein [Kiritimatiellia bacterium]
MDRREFLLGIAAGAALPFTVPTTNAADTSVSVKSQRFQPMTVEGLEKRPDFWKVRPDEIIALCESAKKCSRKEVICHTPLGYPVYALFYGDFNDAPPQTNWSAGSSSTTYKNYMGNPPPAKQTFLFFAGVHGAEPETVAGAVNLVQALETGKDFRGRTHDELLKLIDQYRFIIVPCVNLDGRGLSPDHLHGIEWTKFRAVSQGTWKDGSLVGWRGSKAWFPLPLDRVSYPGGYPNADGYNIMHDAAPGNIRTAEARALLRLAERWRVDAVLNGHSYEHAPSVLTPSAIDTPDNVTRANAISDRCNAAIHAAGLVQNKLKENRTPRSTINLNTVLALASGAITLTLECSVSYDRPDKEGRPKPTRLYTFDELMEPVFVVLREYLKDGLEKPFLVRGDETVKGD